MVEQQAEGPPGETILVVEDDHDVRAYLAEVLRGLDYRVLTVINAEQSLMLLGDPNIRIDLQGRHFPCQLKPDSPRAAETYGTFRRVNAAAMSPAG